MPISSASAANTKSVWMAGIEGTSPDLRQARPEARAQDAAPAVGVQGADDLVARPLRVGERIEPDVDRPGRAGRAGTDGAAGDEQHQPEHDVRDAPGGDVEQRQEDEEVEQCRAQVALDDDDGQGHAPHRQHRQQVGQRRQLERTDARAGGRQQSAILGQVPGQEDNQDHLQQL
jgi:hypothetical protein